MREASVDKIPSGVAGRSWCRLRRLAARPASVIRIEAIWLTTEPLDMRAGTDAALARVVSVFGCARTHHAYLFANRRASRMKVLVHVKGRRIFPSVVVQISPPGWDALSSCGRTKPALSLSFSRNELPRMFIVTA